MKLLLFFFICVPLLVACNSVSTDRLSIRFTNYSDLELRVYCGYCKEPSDTGFTDHMSWAIKPYSTSLLTNHQGVEYSCSQVEKLMLFVFDVDTLKKYSYEELRTKYNALKRYDLSINDLDQLEWKVAFPPSEAMKDMKMYPPYEGE